MCFMQQQQFIQEHLNFAGKVHLSHNDRLKGYRKMIF